MNDLLFSVFPSDNFVDLSLFQFGRENARLPIPSDLPQEITFFFIM